MKLLAPAQAALSARGGGHQCPRGPQGSGPSLAEDAAPAPPALSRGASLPLRRGAGPTGRVQPRHTRQRVAPSERVCADGMEPPPATHPRCRGMDHRGSPGCGGSWEAAVPTPATCPCCRGTAHRGSPGCGGSWEATVPTPASRQPCLCHHSSTPGTAAKPRFSCAPLHKTTGGGEWPPPHTCPETWGEPRLAVGQLEIPASDTSSRAPKPPPEPSGWPQKSLSPGASGGIQAAPGASQAPDVCGTGQQMPSPRAPTGQTHSPCPGYRAGSRGTAGCRAGAALARGGGRRGVGRGTDGEVQPPRSSVVVEAAAEPRVQHGTVAGRAALDPSRTPRQRPCPWAPGTASPRRVSTSTMPCVPTPVTVPSARTGGAQRRGAGSVRCCRGPGRDSSSQQRGQPCSPQTPAPRGPPLPQHPASQAPSLPGPGGSEMLRDYFYPAVAIETPDPLVVMQFRKRRITRCKARGGGLWAEPPRSRRCPSPAGQPGLGKAMAPGERGRYGRGEEGSGMSEPREPALAAPPSPCPPHPALPLAVPCAGRLSPGVLVKARRGTRRLPDTGSARKGLGSGRAHAQDPSLLCPALPYPQPPDQNYRGGSFPKTRAGLG